MPDNTLMIQVQQDDSSIYPIQFTYFIKTNKVVATLANQQIHEDSANDLDDFFDFVYSNIQDEFRAAEWSGLKSQIQVLFEDRDQRKFTILSDRTLQK